MGTSSKSRELDRYVAHVESSIERLTKLGRETIAELQRRAEESSDPDGFPAGGQGEGRSQSETTSTEAAALRGLPDDEETPDDWRRHEVADPIAQTISEILAMVIEVAGITRRIDRKREVVLNSAASLRGRQSSIGNCLCCHRDVPGTPLDRLRSGYCHSCHQDWCSQGKPDRLIFEIDRRQRLAAREAEQNHDPVFEAIPDLQSTGALPTARSAR